MICLLDFGSALVVVVHLIHGYKVGRFAFKIKSVDEDVARLNDNIRRPRSLLVRSALRAIRLSEESDVERIIDSLSTDLKEL